MITLNTIQKIKEYCMKALDYTRRSRSGMPYKYEEIEKSINESLRKILIASIMENKKVICITGAQGTGKTTLIKNFYDLDEQYLKGCRGRGERIPILITEKKIDTPSMHVFKIIETEDGSHDLQDVVVDSEEFDSAARGEDESTMYLELQVPYKHINNARTSFMLLPGFEENNTYWDSLIDFSVNSCDAAVIVFSPVQVSDGKNDRIVRKIKEKFGENLVYALTHSHTSIHDDVNNNMEIKKTLMEILDIPEPEEDRIVLTGCFFEESMNDAWKKILKESLQKYVNGGKDRFQRENVQIYQEVDKIQKYLYDILDILDSNVVDDEIDNSTDRKFLSAFDEKTKKVRRELNDLLRTEMGKGKEESQKYFGERFEQIPFLKQLSQRLFGEDVKSIREKEQMIKDSFRMEDGRYRTNYCMRNALIKMLDANGNGGYFRTQYLPLLVDLKKDEKGRKYLQAEGEKTLALEEDVRNLLICHEDSDQPILLTKDPVRLMGAIVELGTFYFCLSVQDKMSQDMNLDEYEPPKVLLSSESMFRGAKESKKLIVGIAGMMGIDVLEDGSINLISKIAEAIGVGVSEVAIGVGIILGAGMAIAIERDINKMQRDDFYAGRNAIEDIYDNAREGLLNSFDDCMIKIRDRIIDNLNRLHGNGRSLISAYNAKIEINNAINLLDRILDTEGV